MIGMRKIGIDKRDPLYRHFYYNDMEVLSSNPPKYKVWYVDDENDIDYIECGNVIKIKDAPEENNIEKHLIMDSVSLSKTDNPIEESNAITISSQEASVMEIDTNHDGNADITITSPSPEIVDKLIDSNIITQPEQKKRGRKKKNAEKEEQADVNTVSNVLVEQESMRKTLESLRTTLLEAKLNKFEYKAFNVDFSSSTELVDLLNEYGMDGWELCASELYSEGVIFDKKKIFCIMKRIKGLDK